MLLIFLRRDRTGVDPDGRGTGKSRGRGNHNQNIKKYLKKSIKEVLFLYLLLKLVFFGWFVFLYHQPLCSN